VQNSLAAHGNNGLYRDPRTLKAGPDSAPLIAMVPATFDPGSERLAPDRARVEHSFMKTFVSNQSKDGRRAKRADGVLFRCDERSLGEATFFLEQMVDQWLPIFMPKIWENVEDENEVQSLRFEVGRLILTEPSRVYYTIRYIFWMKDGDATARGRKQCIPSERPKEGTGTDVEEVWLLGQNNGGQLWMSLERTSQRRRAHGASGKRSRGPKRGRGNLRRLLRRLPTEEDVFTFSRADSAEVQYLRMGGFFAPSWHELSIALELETHPLAENPPSIEDKYVLLEPKRWDSPWAETAAFGPSRRSGRDTEPGDAGPRAVAPRGGPVPVPQMCGGGEIGCLHLVPVSLPTAGNGPSNSKAGPVAKNLPRVEHNLVWVRNRPTISAGHTGSAAVFPGGRSGHRNGQRCAPSGCPLRGRVHAPQIGRGRVPWRDLAPVSLPRAGDGPSNSN